MTSFLTSDLWVPITEDRPGGITSTTTGVQLFYTGGLITLGAANSSFAAIYIDQGDSPVSGQGKIRIRSTCQVNAVAPTINFVVSLSPIATFGGASGAAPTVATLGTAVVTVTFTTPAASSQTKTDSTAISVPTSGWYAMSVQCSASPAANSQAVVHALLQRQFA